MSRSTTHRYVITLVALGYLEQGASRKYRLGLRVTDLGMSALSSTGLREHAQPYLEELRQRTSCRRACRCWTARRCCCSIACAACAVRAAPAGPDLQAGSRLPAYSRRAASCCSPICPRPSSASCSPRSR